MSETRERMFDACVVKIVEKAYADFDAGQDNRIDYRSRYFDLNPESIYGGESLYSVYVKAWEGRAKQVEEKKNHNKVFGKIDLSKFKKG